MGNNERERLKGTTPARTFEAPAAPVVSGGATGSESLAQVQAALAGLRFGSVLLTVHEGRIVQIDVTEKRRFIA